MFHHYSEPGQEAHAMPEREFAAIVDDMVASLDRPVSETQKPQHSSEPNTARDTQ